MNREQIIRMAVEAELNLYVNDLTEKQYIEVIERFANLVASAERKKCVEVIKDNWIYTANPSEMVYYILERGQA